MSDGMLIDFNELRHDEEYHLGLGDIRLTIGMQGDIEKNFAFWIEETKKLQARIELKDNIIEMADENVKILKARISELEKALIESSDKLYETRKQIDLHDSIKAEGIREMLNAFDETLTPENDISCYSLEDFADEYADKLASDNEALEKGE